MDHLPLFFDLRARRVLVVGGGEPAARKIRLLRKARAEITVIAPRTNGEIAALADAAGLTLERRPFAAADVLGRAAVFGATGAPAVDAAVAEAARAANVPVNISDCPELSNFIVPAIVERDPVVIGISTGGAAPVLARALRARIESLLPARLGALARFAAHFRRAVHGVLPTQTARRRFWERFFDSPVAEAVLAGDEGDARLAMLPFLNRVHADAPRGVVYLVGAGPDDPDLLTFRALRLMQQADVVLYDETINPDILDRVRRDAERVAVRTSKGRRVLSHDDIEALMLREARAGWRVLRLTSGDPFASGRGAEEREFLLRHGIDVITVPGITAALAAPSDAGLRAEEARAAS